MTKDSRKRKRDEQVRELPDVDSGDEQLAVDDDAIILIPAIAEKSTTATILKEKDDKKSKKPQGDESKNKAENNDKSRRQKNLDKHNEKQKQSKGDTHHSGAGTVVEDSLAPKKAARFIVFIGNLPYNAKVESLTEHLATVKPSSIRLPTDKNNPKKAKGFAFVEFSDASRMKTCLKLFHHSLYEGRKINVELTAGGGGSTEARKQKIRGKNEKLSAQRKRRFEEEMKEKAEKGEIVVPVVEKSSEDGVHPSRRKRVKQ